MPQMLYPPVKQPPAAVEDEAGWAPEPVRMWWRQKFPTPAGNQTPKPWFSSSSLSLYKL